MLFPQGSLHTLAVKWRSMAILCFSHADVFPSFHQNRESIVVVFFLPLPIFNDHYSLKGSFHH
jgi:hypothetical protein